MFKLFSHTQTNSMANKPYLSYLRMGKIAADGVRVPCNTRTLSNGLDFCSNNAQILGVLA